MANDLFPGYIVIDYHSAWAPHKMTIPTRAPIVSIIGEEPQYTAWDDTTINAGDMIDDLAALLQIIADPGIVLDSATVYNVPAPEDLPQPIWSHSIGLTGTAATTGWAKAVQTTFVMRTTAFGLAKLTILDFATENDFGKQLVLAADYHNVVVEIMSTGKAWSGRDGARPAVFKNATITLNEKLRREYHLT